MATEETHTDPSTEQNAAGTLAPEADFQEQHAPWLSENGELPVAGPAASVPEADWLEQAQRSAPAKPVSPSTFNLRAEIPEADYEEQMMLAYEEPSDDN